MNKKEETNPFFAGQTDPRKEDPYLDLAKSKENWRLAFFICAITLLFVTGAFIVRSFQAKYVPYLVSVDDFDQITILGSAEQLSRNDQRLVRAELYQWLRSMRSVYGDEQLVIEQLSGAFSMLSSDVAARMNEYYAHRENDPRLLVRTIRRTIEVTQILPTDEQGTWRLQWVETTMPVRGSSAQTQTWEAYIKIQNQPPTSSEGILQNPLGIYITELNWGSITPLTEQ
jgi:type IV secretion system protein TrbF